MDEALERRLESVLRMHLPKAPENGPLPMDVPLVELGLDSLRAVSLVLDLEETFGVEFPDQVLSEATFETGASIGEALHVLILDTDGADAP
jgi:acyl carrier protein